MSRPSRKSSKPVRTRKAPPPSAPAAAPVAGSSDEGVRRAVFAALAETLAGGADPNAARYAVARRFVLTVVRIEAIEREGHAKGWSAD